MHMKIKQHILKKFVDTIYKINSTEIKLEIKKEGIHTILVDPAHVELLKIRIPYTACDEYNIEKTGEIDLGIDPTKLKDFLKLYKKDDMVTADYNEETNRLMLKVGNLIRGMGLIDTAGMMDPEIPKIDFKNKFTINSKTFYDSLKKVSKPKKYQDFTKITISENGVNLEEFEEDPEENSDITSIFLDINIDDLTIQYVNAEPNMIFTNNPVLKQVMEYSKLIDYLTVETNGYNNPIRITGICDFLEVEYWRAQMEPSEEYCKHKTLIEEAPENETEIETETERKIEEPLIAELRYGATEIILYKDTWFYNGDIEHNGKENIEHNAKVLKEIYEKYKDQIKKLVGVSKDYDKDYVYLMSSIKKKTDNISSELKVWTDIKPNDYYNNSYRANRWTNYSDLLEEKTEEKYCPECGRKLVNDHCPVHLEVIPVDKDALIVQQYKEIEELENKVETDLDKPVEPLIAVKNKEETATAPEKKEDVYSDRQSICKPKGLPYDKNKWTSDMEKYKDKLYKQSEKESKKALSKVIDKEGFVFFIVHSDGVTGNIKADKNICESIITELLPEKFVLIAWFQIKFEKWVAQTVKKA